MEAKKIFESGKLHGVYRCGKREEMISKIPRIEKEGMPDITGIIISGIMNFGNDADTIRMMAKDTIGCRAEDVKIPYDESKFARQRFVTEVITGKLTGSIRFSTESLINTFYEFLDMPTETTKQMQAKDDIRDIERYLHCEYRRPVINGHPVVDLCNTGFECQMDFMFKGYQTIKTNKHKEGRKWVYDEETVFVLEAVRLFTGKPTVKESSKILDTGISTRLELYVMLKAMEHIAKEEYPGQQIMLRASYYFLQKEREDDKKYSEEFFDGKGGNVITLQSYVDDMSNVDKTFEPQMKEFLKGQSVSSEKCKTCRSRVLCEYYDAAEPLTEEERPKPVSLPILSPNQEKAASALEGNVRVIATAGSGKTTAMAYRIMNLLKAGVQPEKIGCFTFTNAGAGEMRDRIKGFCGLAGIDVDFDKMIISTIHSFGDSLLKQYYNLLGYSKPPVLINEIQKTKIIESILSESSPIEALIDKYKNFYLDMFRAKGILELMKGYFSSIMEGMSQDEFAEKTGFDTTTVDSIYNMYMQYDKYKKDACLIEHSDQELGVLKLLRVKPDLFDEVGIEHISVDEYQDTSNVQFSIINEMRKAKCVKSLFIVGDDDQSIYGFRDANVELIKNFFEMIGENGLDVQLMENRRSTHNIVDFASTLISYNQNRIEKHPKSTNEEGEPVCVSAFASKEDEQEYIVDVIEDLIKNGRKDNEIAILAPTNAELMVYADMLKKRGIESVSINPEPILENPRVVGAVGLVKFMLNNSEFNGTAYINARDNGTAITKSDEEIRQEILNLQNEVKNIKNVTGLFEKFKALDQEENDEIYQSFLEDINTAMEDAVKQENLHAVCEYVMDFERFGQKQTARKEKAYNGVVLSTMHSSKGKEWPVVFCSVTKMHGRDLKPEDIDEKNRLLFVACTRAKKELYISGVAIAFSSAMQGDVENMFLAECIEVYENMYGSTDKESAS
ncbi:ATP-dependent helicase [Blautia glucerasea]|uniref:ATP-dependent helicase n=1 Tax=Blautia TaxID=572511 RepID=UPI00156DF478|nr:MULTISPECIES: ATP-dependent helicase [Blautia]MCB5381642.1 ATP-dependent helicase [Blautia glucerasea]NSJ69771.1 ATP-dependent helicase [Blautia faecis]